MPLNNFGTCGPHFRSAQPDASGFDTARNFVGTILKLNTDDEFPLKDEARLFAPGDIWHVPMDSFRPFEAQVRELVAQLQRTRACLIHCTHGRDRTGFVCAAWRILVDHWTFNDAWAEMQQYGWTPISSLTDHAIHEVLEHLGRTP